MAALTTQALTVGATTMRSIPELYKVRRYHRFAVAEEEYPERPGPFWMST